MSGCVVRKYPLREELTHFFRRIWDLSQSLHVFSIFLPIKLHEVSSASKSNVLMDYVSRNPMISHFIILSRIKHICIRPPFTQWHIFSCMLIIFCPTILQGRINFYVIFSIYYHTGWSNLITFKCCWEILSVGYVLLFIPYLTCHIHSKVWTEPPT
jgi:hypothetical protein